MYDIGFFSSEWKMIKDTLLQGLVNDALSFIVPDYFWSVAASITGKHHPYFSNGEGGLCRHSKFVTHQAARMADYNEKINKDVVICAALLHDICKYGFADTPDEDASRWSFKNHGQIAATKLRGLFYDTYGDRPGDIFKSNSPLLELEKDWLHICDCVETHNGRWTVEDGSVLPKTKEAWVVHFADMAASANLPKEIFEYEKEQE